MHAWEQFQVVWADNGEEVFGVVCCANCKNYFIYKKLIRGCASKVNGNKKSIKSLKALCGFMRH